MNWHSVSEFVAMGGYGLYVWGSVGAVVAVIFAELGELVWRRRTILQTLRRSP